MIIFGVFLSRGFFELWVAIQISSLENQFYIISFDDLMQLHFDLQMISDYVASLPSILKVRQPKS